MVLKGSDCEYIKLASIPNNFGCSDGTKFVIKQNRGVRKQLLIWKGDSILAFIAKGKKFAQCNSTTDVTSSVTCKEVSGIFIKCYTHYQFQFKSTLRCQMAQALNNHQLIQDQE